MLILWPRTNIKIQIRLKIKIKIAIKIKIRIFNKKIFLPQNALSILQGNLILRKKRIPVPNPNALSILHQAAQKHQALKEGTVTQNL
jgi:hypothetical protein